MRELLELLDAGGDLEPFLGRDGEHDRRAILGDWRRRLVDRGLAHTTVNLALAAATSLLDSLALPTPRVPRIEVDPAPSRALTPDRLRAVEYETDRLASTRDRAIMELLLRTGLRIGELADLDAGDVRLTRAPASSSSATARATAAASSRSTARPAPRYGRGSPTAYSTTRSSERMFLQAHVPT